MENRIKKIEEELKNTIKAMQQVKEQIKIYNAKGEELAQHANYLNGKLDMLKELEGEENV